MKKLLKYSILGLLIVTSVYIFNVMKDHQALGDQIIRLHVVGESDSEKDQGIKELVRDAILEKLDELNFDGKTKEDIQRILSENLLTLRNTANLALQKAGSTSSASVTLMEEAFPTRAYDTFTLPAGVYDSLRIVIGGGKGRNWWCVVFPSLCIPAASQEVEEVAVSAGFSDGLGKTITHENGYEVRFFLLDLIGKVENFFFSN